MRGEKVELLRRVVGEVVSYPVRVEDDWMFEGLGLISQVLSAVERGNERGLEENPFWRWWQDFLKVEKGSEGDPKGILLAWLEDWRKVVEGDGEGEDGDEGGEKRRWGLTWD